MTSLPTNQISVPKTANEFIEQQLHNRLMELEQKFASDAVAFHGGLTFGVDDIIRNVIEEKRKRSNRGRKLTFLLTTNGGYVEVVQRIVDTIRHHYDYVNFVIPNYLPSRPVRFSLCPAMRFTWIITHAWDLSILKSKLQTGSAYQHWDI